MTERDVTSSQGDAAYDSPPSTISRWKENKPPPPSQREYEAMKAGFEAMRDLLLCKCLRATGLRLSEVLQWTPADFEWNGPELRIWTRRSKKRGKGGQEGIPIKRELAIEIREWVNVHKIAPTRPVFSGRKKEKPVTRAWVWEAFRRASMATLGRPVYPHQIRSLFIIDAVDQGMPLASVAKLVGHSDVRTTLKHYYELTDEKRRGFAEQIQV